MRKILFCAASLLLACGAPEVDQSSEAVNPSFSETTVQPPCGKALATFAGTTAYSNGGDTGSGYSCAGQGAYGYQYQCVELAMRFFKTHYNLSWWGNARDLLHNAPRSQVDVYGNGDRAHPPVPGDMVVWEVGQWGHVAVISGVHAGGVDIIEQNVRGETSGRATLPYDGASIGARWGNWVPAGWAHAKANGNTGGGNTGGGPSGTPWSCNDSDWHGQQYWTCTNGSLHECQGGKAVERTCDRGCFWNGVGRDDLCVSGASGWSCGNSAWQGKQYWTCSGGSLYRCDASGATVVHCPAGCISNPVGTNDACK